jgi:hypothetical protein
VGNQAPELLLPVNFILLSQQKYQGTVLRTEVLAGNQALELLLPKGFALLHKQ